MTTISAKRCSFCGKPAVCVTRVTADGDGVSICLACATEALRLLASRFHARAIRGETERECSCS